MEDWQQFLSSPPAQVSEFTRLIQITAILKQAVSLPVLLFACFLHSSFSFLSFFFPSFLFLSFPFLPSFLVITIISGLYCKIINACAENSSYMKNTHTKKKSCLKSHPINILVKGFPGIYDCTARAWTYIHIFIATLYFGNLLFSLILVWKYLKSMDTEWSHLFQYPGGIPLLVFTIVYYEFQ